MMQRIDLAPLLRETVSTPYSDLVTRSRVFSGSAGIVSPQPVASRYKNVLDSSARISRGMSAD